MLVLSRKPNETIVIDGNIRITVVSIRGNQVRLGIEAPDQVGIYRVDCFSECLLAAPAAEADVVTEQLQRHASSSGWTTT